MSQLMYFKMMSHIVTDSEKSSEIAEDIASKLDSFIKSLCCCEPYKRTKEDGFDEISAEHLNVYGGGPLSDHVNEIISSINTLDNGSYGYLFGDTEFGVSQYKCYKIKKAAWL